jgi:peroxiredoxin
MSEASAAAPVQDRIPFRLLPGDPAPWFFAPTAANPRYNFASVAGRYVLIVFPGPLASPAAREAHRLLRAAQAEGPLNDTHAAAFVVSVDPADDGPGGPRDAIPGLRVFSDRGGAVSRLYGVVVPPGAQGGPAGGYVQAAFLLDPLLRVIQAAPLARLGELLALLRRLPEPALHTGLEVPAPSWCCPA